MKKQGTPRRFEKYKIINLLCLGTKRFDSEKAGDREVQRTMLELLNQLDGFQPNSKIKVVADYVFFHTLDPLCLDPSSYEQAFGRTELQMHHLHCTHSLLSRKLIVGPISSRQKCPNTKGLAGFNALSLNGQVKFTRCSVKCVSLADLKYTLNSL